MAPSIAAARAVRSLRPAYRRYPILAVALALALLATVPASAQERDTGRRRPPAPRPVPTREVPNAALAATPALATGGERWFAGLGLGLVDGGDLFRVATASGVPVAWGRDGQTWFTASRFRATIEPSNAVTAFAGRRLGRGSWWLRGELATGACDVTAKALLGQVGEVFLYDHPSLITGTLAAEGRLTSKPSHPYASLGLTFCRLSADRVPELDQTVAGVRGALGYRRPFGRLQVTAEASLRRMTLDLKDFRPTTANASQPAVDYAPADGLWLLEVRLAAARSW